MTTQEVFDAIIDFEHGVGESFFDRFDSYVNAVSFMFWARGKNYINVEQFNEWEHAYENGELEADCLNYYVYTDDEDVTFSVVIDEEMEEETYHAALHIFSEFIAESSVYTNRFEGFIISGDY
ncbi:hypothetical protein P4H82_27300 [Bacillus cereus]|nr:hypothetical protein [Bacillus cereus]MEB9190508.1 hypothetical protein [Bacillus cereus]